MDAIKILGSLLANGALGGNGSSNSVIGSLLGAALGGSQNNGMAGMLGSLLGGGGNQQQSGGIGDLLGGLLGGGSQQPRTQQGNGGIGDLLGSLMGGAQAPAQGSAASGGIGDLLGGLLGGGAQGSGAIPGGLGGLLGGAVSKYAQTQNPSAGDLASNFFPSQQAEQEAQSQAVFVIRAMINAAKADGKVDEKEQERIVSKLGDLTQEEAAFIRDELNQPLDLQGFLSDVPKGTEQQVYAVSLMAIDLDTNQEANYLQQLAQGLNLSPEVCNQIHQQVGAPTIFS